MVLAGFTSAFPWPLVAVCVSPLLAFHSGVGLFYRRRVNRMVELLRPLAVETTALREGLLIMEEHRFQSAKLKQLAERVRHASASIRKLEPLLDALHQREKEWFYGPSRWLLIGTQVCMETERWRRAHGDALRVWLAAWAEFEALNALAAYGYENPDNIFPELSAEEACFEARGLCHPLLPHAACVANDVELAPFYVISGSNMSGKSTLLRAIGLNAVLAFAGAPVRASALRLSKLSIFASLSITDSLLNGKSRFLAEVDRLRHAIESSGPALFLVDEIFSGTNSRDRRIAAEAVVRALVKQGAIGALSTHDLALTEIANAEGLNGVNVHMGSRDGSDPLDFDYLLKPGVTRESNGLVIARLAGVPV
jgi:DNA mismatch repair ATPase MutS